MTGTRLHWLASQACNASFHPWRFCTQAPSQPSSWEEQHQHWRDCIINRRMLQHASCASCFLPSHLAMRNICTVEVWSVEFVVGQVNINPTKEAGGSVGRPLPSRFVAAAFGGEGRSVGPSRVDFSPPPSAARVGRSVPPESETACHQQGGSVGRGRLTNFAVRTAHFARWHWWRRCAVRVAGTYRACHAGKL